MEKSVLSVTTPNVLSVDYEPHQPSGTRNCIDTSNGRGEFTCDFERTPAGREAYLRLLANIK